MEKGRAGNDVGLMNIHGLPPFDLALPARIVFGRGKAAQAPELLAGFGSRILLVHGANPQRSEWLTETLQALGMAVATQACSGEPDLPLLELALERTRDFNPDAVVALGGGSVIDLGKALAGLARASRPVTDYLEVVGKGLPLDAEPLPFVALPTTAGTGSEVTRNAVIGIPEHRRKVSLRDPRMLADLVVVDPALTDNCPRHVTLASGLDAITQLIEPYVCSRANAFTDSLCLNALPPALEAIRILMERDEDDARDAMAWASLCGGLALANAGLGAVHGLAGVIGGMTGAPHGEICASLLPATLTSNRTAMKRSGIDTARVDNVFGMLATAFSETAQDGAEALRNWSRGNGIRSITELGLAQSQFGDVARAAVSSSSMRANPVELPVQGLCAILEASS
jgi:alcohol dehydrogenase class IV